MVYLENPEQYTGYSNVKTGKILAIIGVILSCIYLITYIVFLVLYGFVGLTEMQEEWIRNVGM